MGGTLRFHVRGSSTRHLSCIFCSRDGPHRSVFCLGFKPMLVTKMLAEPVRATIGLAAQAADKVEDVLRVVVPNDVLDRLMF